MSRNKNSSSLQESGLTSTSLAGGRRGNADQELDAESAAGLARVKETDAEIDAGIDAISRTMDNIANLSSQMRDEVRCRQCLHPYCFSCCSSSMHPSCSDIHTKREIGKDGRKHEPRHAETNCGECPPTSVVEVDEVTVIRCPSTIFFASLLSLFICFVFQKHIQWVRSAIP